MKKLERIIAFCALVFISGLFGVEVSKETGACAMDRPDKDDLGFLTEKINTDIYTRRIRDAEYIELKQESKEEGQDKTDERIELIKDSISQDIIQVLRVNWELGNKQLRIQIHWVLLQLILKTEVSRERPKGMGLLCEYSDCLNFIKTHQKLLLRSGLTREEKILSAQRACVSFFDNLFKIRSKWSRIGLEEYYSLSRRVQSSELYMSWMELYKVDPPRSQWLILRRLAINQSDEILRLFKLLTRDDEYRSIENIFIEFMTQFNYYDDCKLNEKVVGREMSKYFKARHSGGWRNSMYLLKCGSKGRDKGSSKNFRIYLPEEMPDLYLYHHQVNTCVLNLGIMSLYPELRVFFYDVLKRRPTYYIFHRKSISVSRKTLLRSNQLCNLMLELTRRLERSYYLMHVRQKRYLPLRDLEGASNFTSPLVEELGLSGSTRKGGLVKPLPFHSYYYSSPLDTEIQLIFTSWRLYPCSDRDALITWTSDYAKSARRKHADSFLDPKIDMLKKFVSDDEHDLRASVMREERSASDGLFLLYFRKKADVLRSNRERMVKYLGEVAGGNGSEADSHVLDQSDLYPSVFSMVPILFINSNLWGVHKFLYRYPVSVQANLKKLLSLSETVKIGEKALGDIRVRDISTCIKVATIFWKNKGIKVNNRTFRIIDSDNLSELYEKSEELSKVYMDYATLYLLCVKSVSQGLVYHRRVLMYQFGQKFDDYWRLSMQLDMNDEESSNSFQYINKRNINLHSLPNDFIVPKLTKGVYISILSAYLLLTIGAVCIQSLITIIF
ncbi:putative signal peptide and a transmembrane domain-containing protein [Cryptosporidium canis]|uniref:Signal peptide and a transmembrane domain-containing protein n=1 Tax=Cryptosporidium canis TaxID=195482 RepID=A0ABQ8PA84_9CRYT|nr:putative signal peptide and a transmembrane domain-containing protein [Cryptosporidium canis]KAJ1615038.1 putative signal peptide and a transmembrane domain-containing protein [Cryptosporidium canis]